MDVLQMKKPLLDVIFASEKRKNTLLLLQDGTKKMEFLLKSLDTTRQALLPQIKVLEEHHLVSHYKDTYELTTIGKLIVDEMAPFVRKLEVFDNGIDYWGTRNLDFIPPYLLKKMDELENCEIINPPITDLYSFHMSFNPDYKISSSVYIITTIFYPNFYAILTEMLKNNLTIDYIVSQELLDKVKTEYYEEFATFIKNKSFHLYLYNKEMNFSFIVFDNVHLLMSMLKINGEFDHKFMLCKGKSSVDWVKGLFEYYLEDSTPITQI